MKRPMNMTPTMRSAMISRQYVSYINLKDFDSTRTGRSPLSGCNFSLAKDEDDEY